MQAEPATTADTDADAFDRDLAAGGPIAAVDGLIARLDERGEARPLLDALLLRARIELGLPTIQVGSLVAIEPTTRSAFEERYVAAVRRVGHRRLADGDIPGAWPYFRAIGEPEPVAAALEAFDPGGPDVPADDRLGAIVDLAFHGGAHPRRGFELILGHYGACSAITAFEHLPPDEATRSACVAMLVRHLHAGLVADLRDDIVRRGEAPPPEGSTIPELLAGRPWLLVDEAYHLDVSHLAAVVRASPLLADRAEIARAAELAAYGMGLADRHKPEGDPPFARPYEDHALYLRALLGAEADVAAALDHFRSTLPSPESADEIPDPDPTEAYFDAGPPVSPTLAAQVFVRLLVRLGRLDEAVDVAAEHLAGLPESALACPTLAQLCAMAGRPDRLAEVSRTRGDLVPYAAARLQAAGLGRAG